MSCEHTYNHLVRGLFTKISLLFASKLRFVLKITPFAPKTGRFRSVGVCEKKCLAYNAASNVANLWVGMPITV